ncbi:DNA polymerase IV [Tumebacillus sp. ITR2]|uniref:DNA polymerase IV n=1 Tax=Tumebacillus amylolyticus TaxID=2801339 RepID=A0ABS1JFU4_9BACL|nr:DNA polymerase IV [Tumebacillus amylolyticus]MBL0389152.1 DNA polymerase IV [Tumebacillus amylolyticus]
MEQEASRTILHLDMDAFFASVEQRDHPEFRGKPVIIAHPAAVRGVVSTCSYEARRFGVHSAMPTAQAKRLCPHGIFVEPDHRKYSQVSREMMAILARYTPLIEPLSVDEAFLDVTACRKLFGDGITIARRIKEDIRRELNLTASVGIAYNKFLAKLASDLEKPDGLCPITPQDVETRVHPLPISRLWGVGQKSAEQLKRLGLHTIGDVARMDVVRMRTYIGSLADHIYWLANGKDERPVQAEREAKSVGQETTFATDVRDVGFLETTLLAQVEKVARRLRKAGVEGRTLTLKLRYAPWRTITRSHTFPRATDLETPLYQAVKELLAKCGLSREDAIRLIGVQVGNLVPKGSGVEVEEQVQQLSLFDQPAAAPKVMEIDPRQQELSRVVDSLKDKFGEKIVTRARLVKREEE